MQVLQKYYLYQMYYYKSVLLFGSDVEEITSISTKQRLLKGSGSKTDIICPNAIELRNSKMGGVDLMDQLKSATYQLEDFISLCFSTCSSLS